MKLIFVYTHVQKQNFDTCFHLFYLVDGTPLLQWERCDTYCCFNIGNSKKIKNSKNIGNHPRILRPDRMWTVWKCNNNIAFPASTLCLSTEYRKYCTDSTDVAPNTAIFVGCTYCKIITMLYNVCELVSRVTCRDTVARQRNLNELMWNSKVPVAYYLYFQLATVPVDRNNATNI